MGRQSVTLVSYISWFLLFEDVYDGSGFKACGDRLEAEFPYCEIPF